jgi:hypothetical protein
VKIKQWMHVDNNHLNKDVNPHSNNGRTDNIVKKKKSRRRIMCSDEK